MNGARQLWEIQLCEERINKIERQYKQSTSYNELKKLKQDIEIKQGQLKEKKLSYTGINDNLSVLMGQSSQLEVQINDVKSRIFGGMLSSLKEINSHQVRLDSLEKKLLSLEEQQIALMEQKDELHRVVVGEQTDLNGQKDRFRQLHQEYLTEHTRYKQAINEEKLNLEKMIAGCNQELIAMYRQLKKRFTNPVSNVLKEICQGCHMGLSSERARQLKYVDHLVYCDHCGRILYYSGN